jgi:hypothetical protein
VIAAVTSTYLLDINLLEEHRSVHRILPELEQNNENQMKQMEVTE